jgi:hypothetical protein
MFYQYGYFKPLVAWKVGRIMTLRQLVPALFLLVLSLALPLCLWVPAVRLPAAALLSTYVALTLLSGAGVAWRLGVAAGAASAVAFPVLHLSYGVGFLRGTCSLIGRARGRPLDFSSTPLSR